MQRVLHIEKNNMPVAVERPVRQELFVTLTNSGAGRVDVTVQGYVQQNGGGNGWLSLDGMSFVAA